MSFSSEKGRGWGFRLALFFAPTFLAFMATYTQPVYAADFSVSARQTRSATVGSSGMNVDYSLQARFAANDPRYKTAKVKYSPGKVLQFANARKATNPAAAAVNAALVGAAVAAGWVIDELTSQVLSPMAPAGDYVQGKYWAVTSQIYGGAQGATLAELEKSICRLFSAGCYVVFNYPNFTAYDSTGHPEFFGTYDRRTCYSWQVASYCPAEAPLEGGDPINESEWWPVFAEALKNMSPEELREFFNNLSGLPELTPELQQELEDWAAQIEAETGLESEVKEETAKDEAQDIQDVRVNEDGVETEPKTEPIADDLYDPIENFVMPDLPELPMPNIGLQPSNSCQTITFNWSGASVVFPSNSQCDKMNDMKDMLEWLLSVLTLFACWYIILGQRRSPGA